MNLLNLLFESKIDSWLQTQRNNNKFSESEITEVENLLNQFQRFSESIYNKDSTQYDLDLLKVTIESIKLAKTQNLKSQTIKWLTKQIFENPNLTIENIKEDFVPILKSYEKNKIKIEKSLESFETITDLTYFIQDLSQNNQETNDSSKDIIFEKDGWILAMPSNTENSCDLGQGTTWCTARTDSQNLFLSYVGRRRQNIILFYVMKQNGNPRKDPFDKMSVGFVNGKPQFGGEDGTITVNASNKGLSEEQFQNILGNELASEFLAKMKEVSDKVAGKHPAKEELSRIVKDYDLFVKKAETFKNQETLDEFFKVALDYKDINPQIFEYMLSKKPSLGVLMYAAQNPNIPENLFRMLATNDNSYVRQFAASNRNCPWDLFRIFATDAEPFVRMSVVGNPNIPEDVFRILEKDENKYVIEAVKETKKKRKLTESISKLSLIKIVF